MRVAKTETRGLATDVGRPIYLYEGVSHTRPHTHLVDGKRQVADSACATWRVPLLTRIHGPWGFYF